MTPDSRSDHPRPHTSLSHFAPAGQLQNQSFGRVITARDAGVRNRDDRLSSQGTLLLQQDNAHTDAAQLTPDDGVGNGNDGDGLGTSPLHISAANGMPYVPPTSPNVADPAVNPAHDVAAAERAARPVSTKEGHAAAAAAAAESGRDNDDGADDYDLSSPLVANARDAAASEKILGTLPRILLIRPHEDSVLPEHTTSLQDCAHEQDWLMYVRRQMPITDVRFHRLTMFLKDHPVQLDYDDDSSWLCGLELPRDDDDCARINARFKRMNDKSAKESFQRASEGLDVDNTKLPQAYITAVSDHSFVPGLPFSRPCSSMRPQDDFNKSYDANYAYGSLPASRPGPDVRAVPAEARGSAVLSSEAAKTRARRVLDSVEGTFTLATTICGFDPALVIFLRDWGNRQNAFFTQPLQRYYAPSFDVCLPTCPDNCTDHQQQCLLGYCSNCREPLVAAAQKLLEMQNSHGNAKLYSDSAFLEKRVCSHSTFCPGAKKDDHKMGCEKGHLQPYDDRNYTKLHFSPSALYVHDILVDAMAVFSNPSKQHCTKRYMLAFGRAVVPRHANLPLQPSPSLLLHERRLSSRATISMRCST